MLEYPGRPEFALVLDVRLPEVGGLEVQHKLAAAGINIPIIFVTAQQDIPMSVKAMKSGAVEVFDEALPRSGSTGCDSAGIKTRPTGASPAERDRRTFTKDIKA